MNAKQRLSLIVTAVRRQCITRPVTSAACLYLSTIAVQGVAVFAYLAYLWCQGDSYALSFHNWLYHMGQDAYEFGVCGTPPFFATLIICAGAVIIVREFSRGRV